MGLFLVYTIKSAICLLLFFVFNRLILSKETFHRLNRVIWLSVIVLSLTVPAMEWSLFGIDEGVILGVSTGEPLMSILSDNAGDSEASASRYYIIGSIIVIYFSVVVLLIIRLIISYISILNLIRSRTKNRVDQKYIDMLDRCKESMHTTRDITLVIHDDDIAPLSWMSYILMSKQDLDEGGSYILTHEIAHIKGYDSLDVIFLNLLTIFQWFNPASWLCKRALKEVHEYNADDLVLNSGANSREYQLLLIKKAVGQQYHSITNNFNHSTLKNRITMMLKEKSNRWAKAKCLYAIPLALCTVAVFANQEISDSFSELSEVKGSTIFGNSEIVDQNIIINEAGADVAMGVEPLLEQTLADGVATTSSKITETDTTTLKPRPTITRIVSVVGESGKPVMIKTDRSQDKDRLQDEDIPLLVAETMPMFQGGDVRAFREWVSKQLVYPKKAEDANISGQVALSFIVEKDGSVTNIKVLKSPDQSLSDEGVRIIEKSPKWTPGKQRGKEVRIMIIIPISFAFSTKTVSK